MFNNMHSRQKTRFEHQPPQPHYRHQNYGGGVPQHGPPPNVGQARMPNAAAATMRTQQGMNVRPTHVPQQQQQQQQPQQIQNQQVQQQQAHAGVVQHHQYQQVSAQGHHAPHAMYYQPNPHAVPQSYIQISPYPVSVAQNPGMPLHSLTQTAQYIPRFTAYAYNQVGNNQQPTAAYFPATQHTQQMYTATVPQYVHHPRMATAAMHAPSQAVANTQQLQQAPVAQTHAGVVTGITTAQHQQQHSHPQQTGVPVVQQQPQQIARQEQGRRERKILQIVDPKTGQNVLDSTSPATPSTNSHPNTESSSSKGASTSSSTDSAATSMPPIADNKQETPSQNSQPDPESEDAKPKEETVTSIKDESTNAAASDSKKSLARAEFFQKIAQASDETRSSSTTSTGSSTATANSSSNNNANSSSSNGQPNAETPQPVEPVAVAASTPVPTTPTKEKSPSPEPNKQLVANTPVANTSSDDSKDASLVSISPTPMEHYATPRSKEPLSSPPLQPTIEKYAEEEAAEENEPEPSEDGPISEEIIELEENEPVKHKDVEEISDSVQESEVRADSDLSGSVKQEELEKDEEMEVDDPEVIEEIQPNGHVPLEEGEIEDLDDDVEDDSLAEAEVDDREDASNAVRERIKYDRNSLLEIGDRALRTPGTNEFKVGIPDLARDNNVNHINKSHGISMGKNSPGGRDFRGGRGMPGMGNMGPKMSPNMGPQHFRMGMGMGMGGIGQLMVPPPPPNRAQPKVQLSLTREEVKLHKAENAWKPATLKRSSTGDQASDEEAIAVDSIVKKTRGILNKLTPDNFEKLVNKFMELPLEDKDERISSVISVVFEKAIDEPSFSTAYARMVQTICKTSQETSKKFRKKILDQCQKEFQKSSADEADIKEVEQKIADSTDDENREQLKQELEEKKYMSRRRSLGNVRFIGELYKLQMLTPKIMVECVQLLLYAPDEEKLECLCKLLSTVGQKLDIQLQALEDAANRGDRPKFVPEQKWMKRIFNQLKELSENKKFSSRIRFAILDVVELRENDWKPRRDTNAPKTIQEVRNDAMRQEQEEKRQINSLPPVQNNTYGGGGDRDHRAGNSRLPGSMQQKKSDWTTMPKPSSRFQTGVKKSEPPGTGLPVFGPPTTGGFGWQRSQSGPSGPPPMGKQPPNLPPRLQNRFHGLNIEEDNRPSNKGMPNSSQDSGGYRDRDRNHMGSYQPHGGPPSLHSATSPPPSMSSSAENSRPVSPKDNPEVTADTTESVKNIFQEYLASKKFDDTLHWIKGRFPGRKIDDFIEEISRQVAEMSKEVEQKCAGSLVRLLIKNREIPKDSVIKLMAQGVMEELPDILIDSPMATTYLAQFLVEIFSDENNLDWLVQVGNKMIANEDDEGAAWRQLAVNSLNLLKLRNNEENVQTSYKKTDRKNVIPVEELPWLQERTPDSLAEQMEKVLRPMVDSDSSDEIRQNFQENSWDVREETTTRALTEAICRITWNPKTGSWEDEIVKKLLPLLDLPSPKRFPIVWRQVEEFAKRSSIDKKKSEGLWNIMYSMNMTTTNAGSD